MEYCTFSTSVARRVGVNEAIILEHIRHFVEKNTSDGTNIHEGKAWTYNSVRNLVDMYGFLTEKQVRRVIEKIEKDGYVESGKFNKKGYDRTKWYTLTKKGWMLWKPCDSSIPEIGKSNCPRGQIELPLKANRIALEGEPIPVYNNNIYNNTTTNTDTSTTISTDSNSNNNKKDNIKISRPKRTGYLAVEEQIARFTECSELAVALTQFLVMRKSIKKPPTPYAFFRLLNKLKGMADNDLTMAEIVNQSIEHNWQDFYPLRGSIARIDEVLKLAKEREEDGINF